VVAADLIGRLDSARKRCNRVGQRTRACFIEARDNSLILLSSILLERALWCLGSILELQL
jgi:hypothetical protein